MFPEMYKRQLCKEHKQEQRGIIKKQMHFTKKLLMLDIGKILHPFDLDEIVQYLFEMTYCPVTSG